MKVLKKKIFKILLILLFLFIIPLYSVQLKNNIFSIDVNDFFYSFSIKLSKGNPFISSDDGKSIIPDFSPPTSFVQIKCDSNIYKFGSSDGKNQGKAELNSDKIISKWTIPKFKIEVIQSIRFSRTIIDEEEGIIIQYNIVNNDTKNHNIGVRIVIDTITEKPLYEKFYVGGKGEILSDTNILEKDFGGYFVLTDGIINPTSSPFFIFGIRKITTPDIISFSTYERIKKTKWAFKGNKAFKKNEATKVNSAVQFTWEPILFKAGESNGVNFFIGNVMTKPTEMPPFAVNLLSPKKFTKSEMPILIGIENIDTTSDIKDIKVSLELPKGLKAEKTKKIDKLQSGRILVIPAILHADKKDSYKIKINITAKLNNKPVMAFYENILTYE